MTKTVWLLCYTAVPLAAQAQETTLPQAMPTTIWFLLLMLAFVVILGIGFSVQLWRDAQEKDLDSQASVPRDELDASTSDPSPRKR